MSWLVQSRLVNGPFEDPGVYLDFRFGRRAFLFDLGDLGALSARELLRVSHVFVSHAHVDHFAGFDRMLRLHLHRPEPLHLIGPPGFIDRVEHKLRGYLWNLLGEDSVDFRLVVGEFEHERVARMAAFHARDAFRRREAPPPVLPPGCVLDEEQLRVEAATLDHGTPCLAFALRERRQVNVLRGGLERLGLAPGPWLNEVKRAVRTGAPDDTRIPVSDDGATAVNLGELKASALRIDRGQIVAYVTDAGPHDANAAKIVALARDADQLFIEAVYLEEDSRLAATNYHLTAAKAGRLAREAGARHLVPFHFSARYLDRPDAPAQEAQRAFAGESAG